MMRVLVATDAWHPQVNGVVRTLEALARSARDLGVDIQFLSPQGFRSMPMPTYPSLRLALPSARAIAARIQEIEPDSIHIATEGPIGLMTRAYCRKRGLRFTTSYTTRFPEYISARFAIPESWSYAALRRFHAAASLTMVSTPSLAADLSQRGFSNLAMWGRGVDTDAFTPEAPAELGLPRPIFLCHGRVAIEKNLEAFLSLDLPGSKVVVGEGPQEAELRTRFPSVHFLGLKVGKELASYIAMADVFVFPSLTDTFGNSVVEALASGIPCVTSDLGGPCEIVVDGECGLVFDHRKSGDLAEKILALAGDERRLKAFKAKARERALRYTYANAAAAFWDFYRNCHQNKL